MLLLAVCQGSYSPALEVNRKEGKVDLALQHEHKRYLIELGVNLAKTGDGGHSAEGHYSRQVEKYGGDDVAGSIVVVIYTNKHKRTCYYWPSKEDGVQYLIVEHFLELDPYKLSILTSNETEQHLKIAYPTKATPTTITTKSTKTSDPSTATTRTTRKNNRERKRRGK